MVDSQHTLEEATGSLCRKAEIGVSAPGLGFAFGTGGRLATGWSRRLAFGRWRLGRWGPRFRSGRAHMWLHWWTHQ
jgi:hypothetical protein